MDKHTLKQLIEMAEDGYKLSERNGAHQEFLKEDRETLRKARKYLNELSEGNTQPDTASKLNIAGVNCCALLDEFKQYRKEQQELCDFSKKNGHPKSAAFDEGGLNACDKLIAIIKKHCS